MSDEKYYVRFRGRTLGPFDESKVRDLIKRGQVTRMHELSPDGVSWQKAEAFPELFAVASQPAQSFEQTSQAEAVVQSGDSSSDVAEWYAHLNDENKGPVTKTQLAQWIASGALTQESLVWKEGTEEWEPANIAVPELFADSSSSGPNFAAAQQLEPAATSSKPCPFCAQPISSLAVKCPHCQSMLNNFCSNCGTQCAANQAVCLNCGTAIQSNANQAVVVAQPTIVQPNVVDNTPVYAQGNYNKTTAAILAFFIGGLGAHKFYHGSIGWGILYLVFCPTFIPALVSFIEGIMYLTMPDADYDARYNFSPTEPFKW